MRELSDDMVWRYLGADKAECISLRIVDVFRAGYAAGYRAAQAEAPPQEPTAQAADPAADPLPVAWATPSLLVTMSAVEKRRLTSPEIRGRGGEWEAHARDADRYSVPLYRAAALERLRAERAEAERDTLRAVVRAADGLRAECDQVPPMVQQRNVLHAYDAARAKVTLP